MEMVASRYSDGSEGLPRYSVEIRNIGIDDGVAVQQKL